MTEQDPKPNVDEPKPGQEPTPGAKGDTPSEVQFTPEQQKLFDKRVAQAKRDAIAAADAETQRLKDEETAEQERQKQIAAGEFETVKTSLVTERDTVKSERDGLRSQLDTLITAIKPEVDAQWAGLPVEVTELFTGEADDVIGKQSFMTSHKKLIDRLANKQEEKKQGYRMPITPNPITGKPEVTSPLSAREIRGG